MLEGAVAAEELPDPLVVTLSRIVSARERVSA